MLTLGPEALSQGSAIIRVVEAEPESYKPSLFRPALTIQTCPSHTPTIGQLNT